MHAAAGAVLYALGGEPRAALVAWFVLALVFFLAWGPYLADVAMTPMLDPAQRARWRIAIFLVPWSMAVYWVLHVRPARE